MKVSGSNNWWYRRDVPADVRGALKGLTRWSKSLGSGSLRDVAEEARALAAQHDRIIATVRRKDPLEALSAGARKRVEEAGGVEAFMKWQRDRWQRANLTANAADMLRSSLPGMTEVEAEALEAELAAASEAERARVTARAAALVTKAAASGVDPAIAEAETAAFEATARVLDAAIVKDGPILNQLGVDLPPRLRRSVEGSAEVITLRNVFDDWKGAGRASEAQFRIPMEAFEKKFGPVPVTKITVDQCREFRDDLASADRADVTSRKYFTSFKTLLNYAVNDGHIDASPADKLTWRAEKVKHSERIEGKRRTFSPAETDSILKSLAAYATESNDHAQVAWFVRIACWTGMRPEEIAQLAPGDVCEVAGVWVFRVHDLDDNNVKTRAGVREVPVHRWLIDAGLLAFVEKRQKADRLFALCEKTDGRGRRYPPIYSRWNHFMRKRLKLIDTKLSMYSFRHGMKDALRLASVGEYEQDRILGHARKGREVADGYGRAQIVVLNEALQKADPLDQSRTVTLFNGGGDG